MDGTESVTNVPEQVPGSVPEPAQPTSVPAEQPTQVPAPEPQAPPASPAPEPVQAPAQQAAPRDFYAELGRQLAPHAGAIQEWIRQRQQQATVAAQERPAWQAPEYRAEWAQMLERDPETGILRARAGYDPSVAERATAFLEWRERFLTNPAEVVQPLVEARAREIVAGELAAYRQQQAAEAILASNRDWLFEGGRPGGPLTAQGQLYAQWVQQLAAGGLVDPAMQDRAARAMVQAAVGRASASAPAAQQAAAPVAPAVPAAAGGGGSRPGVGQEAPAGSVQGLDLRELLERRMRDVPDEAFASV